MQSAAVLVLDDSLIAQSVIVICVVMQCPSQTDRLTTALATSHALRQQQQQLTFTVGKGKGKRRFV